MFDAFIEYSEKRQPSEIELNVLSGGSVRVPENYYYLTCHREENTADDSSLLEVMSAMNRLDEPTVYPVHPRNRERALRLQKLHKLDRLLLVEPVGYFESACLVRYATKIVTDSGGLQREAFYAQKKCVTVLDFVCWPETMVDNRNELARPDADDILHKLANPQRIDESYHPFGDGKSAVKIVSALEEYCA